VFRFIALTLPFLVLLLLVAELASFLAPAMTPLAAIVLALFGALGVSQRIPKVIDWISFFLGVAVSAGTGWFYFRLVAFRRAATAPDRLQTIVLRTEETPNQVSRAACRGQLNFIVTIGVLVFVFLFLVSLPFSSYILELLQALTRLGGRGFP
jgi:hypothetical protein